MTGATAAHNVKPGVEASTPRRTNWGLPGTEELARRATSR